MLVAPFCIKSQSYNSIPEGIRAILSQKAFRYASVGISVYDFQCDKFILTVNGDKILTPASNLKLLTCFTALERLGPDFTFETKIAYSGYIRAGVLHGDLYIIGSGDPTLGSGKLGADNYKILIKKIVDAVQSAGIQKIKGKIIADESIFDSFPISPSWQWNDVGNYYATGAWGININENQYNLYFGHRKKVGEQPIYKGMDPVIQGLSVSNELTLDSAGTEAKAYVFGGPYNFDKRVVGTIPIGKSTYLIQGAMPDPPKFFSQILSKGLKKKGISHDGIKHQYHKSHKKTTTIFTITSPPLHKIIRQCLHKSNNLYAESLLKTMAYDKYKIGSGGYGIKMIKYLLKKLGIGIRGLQIKDGSGIASRNGITPNLLAKFVGEYSEQSKWDISKYIPQMGREGTVAGLHPKAKVWAKSGSMAHTLCYTGIIQDKDGYRYSFSIMVNRFDIKERAMMGKIVRILDEIRNLF